MFKICLFGDCKWNLIVIIKGDKWLKKDYIKFYNYDVINEMIMNMLEVWLYRNSNE